MTPHNKDFVLIDRQRHEVSLPPHWLYRFERLVDARPSARAPFGGQLDVELLNGVVGAVACLVAPEDVEVVSQDAAGTPPTIFYHRWHLKVLVQSQVIALTRGGGRRADFSANEEQIFVLVIGELREDSSRASLLCSRLPNLSRTWRSLENDEFVYSP